MSDLLQPDTLVIVAMPEEAQPFRDQSTLLYQRDNTTLLRTRRGNQYLLAQSGVGMVNGSMTAALGIQQFQRKGLKRVINAGTAGGIGSHVQAGETIVGHSYLHAHADARAFGYSVGQVPGMPETYFSGHNDVLDAVHSAKELQHDVTVGTIISSDTFITAEHVKGIRGHFPDALAVDMESSAIAQVCHRMSMPFVSVRAISDLCTLDSGEQFLRHVDDAAVISADTVIGMIDFKVN